MPLTKNEKYHYSVTENGNLQLRIVTEYTKDGKVLDKKYSEPMTPADVSSMEGFDDRSKDIVAAIISPEILAEFETEFWAVNGELDPLETIMEIVTTDRVIGEDDKIAVRRINRIFDEGKEVSKKYHRSWIMPGDDSSANDVISKALAQKLHTPAVIATYKNKMAKQIFKTN